MLSKKLKIILCSIAAVATAVASASLTQDNKAQGAVVQETTKCEGNSVTVTDLQAKAIKVEPIGSREFSDEREAVGNIDFNQEQTVPVSSPWSGRIVSVNVKAGDSVRKGAVLFTLDSPDLVQASSTLISSAGVLQLASKSLERARQLAEIRSVSQKDLEQAISDQQTAEANYKAARDAVRIFGKSEAEMDRLVAERKPNGLLNIFSPINGRVTVRNAAPGMLVQPGGSPAPITVADVSSVWMIANVPESLLPRLQVGARVSVMLSAYPGRRFEGKIVNIGAAADATTHTIPVRSEISDPKHELLPQMLATFVIRTGAPSVMPAVPQGAVVREGDGTTTVYVTENGLRFERRVIKPGVSQGGFQQILEGVRVGEKVAAEGALFLSNALALSIR
ncbi:efflux RND transporter periplasmic adaptor subunit [uncultured Propionivibrio sp.]|uniref:efflux RND transporter periplasmic adaptor subunit n=1 Tax=uncultured Propionivibrio sp. TaxID=426737 RepID=UPI0029C05778|nr:efflux RND transporter periplasmic adaptor subunit [uncultured Propionivibrio sp.]